MSIACRPVLGALACVLLVGSVGTIISPTVRADSRLQQPGALISFRFMHSGTSLILPVGLPTRVSANGVLCQNGGPTPVVEATQVLFKLPSTEDPDCGLPGDTLRYCAGACAEFVWDGGDETVGIEIPRSEGSTFVTAQFTRHGVPVAVTPRSWTYSSAGIDCVGADAAFLGQSFAEVSRFWPPDLSPGGECSAVGASVQASFETEEYGTVTGNFVWQGSDVVFDVPVTGLPPTGGPPASASSSVPIYVGAALLGAGLLLAGVAHRRRGL